MPRRPRILLALLLLIAAVGCSSTSAPQTRLLAPLDPTIEPALYVTTTSEREFVLSALQQAGFTIVDDALDAPAVLAVRLGSTRARKKCGGVRNVVFRMSRAGVQLADIKGRGWTGSCNPGILHEMSAELRRQFGAPSR